MKLKAQLIINQDIENIYKLLLAEQKQTNNQRSSFDFKKINDELIITVKSDDSVALRATLNTLTKILTVYENTRGLIK